MKRDIYEDQEKQLHKVLKRIDKVLEMLAKDREKRIAKLKNSSN